MIIACDFDGVIHDKANPVPHRRMGAPLPDAASALSALHNAGHTLVIHTVMATNPGGQKAVEDWLIYYKVPFHEVTAIKPNADLFIDDKAIRHTDWPTTMVEISRVS